MKSFEALESNPAVDQAKLEKEAEEYDAGLEIVNYAPMTLACTLTTQLRGEPGQTDHMREKAENLLATLAAKILSGAPKIDGVSLEDGGSLYACGHNSTTMGPARRFFLKGTIGPEEPPQVREAHKQALEQAAKDLRQEAKGMGLNVS